jgi:hypothetical protein
MTIQLLPQLGCEGLGVKFTIVPVGLVTLMFWLPGGVSDPI